MSTMVSFRFLNPRMVDQFPRDVCYRGIGDEPDVLCKDLPPNQLRFLGWWYLSPERHFWEWLGFSMIGMAILYILGPKLYSKSSLNASRSALQPRGWMAVSTLFLYPYVAYTKLSWPGSYYKGRWLMFVGMPVGTLWLLSVIFCATSMCSIRRGSEHRIRFWLLETWFSFLPLLLDLLPELFFQAISNGWGYIHLQSPHSGQDGDNAYVAYFCHGLYLVLVPIYYSWIGELSSQPTPKRLHSGVLWSSMIDCTLLQFAGTAIIVVYYMGIITPVAIIYSANVNLLLWGYGGPNFRIHYTIKWFCHGCIIRYIVDIAKIVIQKARTRLHPSTNVGVSERRKQWV